LIRDIDPATLEQLRESAKADLVASSLGEAVKKCIEAAGLANRVDTTAGEQKAVTAAA
jgi:hypothetical protein